jgi:hypothetical protein
MIKKQEKMYGLCYRCEYRAQYLEDVLNAKKDEKGNPVEMIHSPRCECGSGSHFTGKLSSVYSCYMYRPVAPYILKADKGEKRSLTAPFMVSGRAHAVGIAKTAVFAKKIKEGIVFICSLIPKATK